MIVKVPHPVLTRPAKEVKKFDKKAVDIINRLKKILNSADNPKGVGLAAPQIGESLRIFVTKPREPDKIRVFINPKIISQSRKLSEIKRTDEDKDKSLAKEKKLEGCLSIENVWGYLKRPSTVKLRFMDDKGKIKEEDFNGFMATIIQHETDHLNGILFTQRVLEQNQKLYRIEKTEKNEEQLVEIVIENFMNVVFFGSSDYCLPVLRALDKNFDLKAVVAKKSLQSASLSPVIRLAEMRIEGFF